MYTQDDIDRELPVKHVATATLCCKFPVKKKTKLTQSGNAPAMLFWRRVRPRLGRRAARSHYCSLGIVAIALVFLLFRLLSRPIASDAPLSATPNPANPAAPLDASDQSSAWQVFIGALERLPGGFTRRSTDEAEGSDTTTPLRRLPHSDRLNCSYPKPKTGLPLKRFRERALSFTLENRALCTRLKRPPFIVAYVHTTPARFDRRQWMRNVRLSGECLPYTGVAHWGVSLSPLTIHLMVIYYCSMTFPCHPC